METVPSTVYALQHVATMMARQSDQILQERLGIGMSQFRILMMLQQEPGLQQRELADRLGQTEASISRQIKLMSEKGYLTSSINPKSKREHVAVPTPKGLKITEAAKEALDLYGQPLEELLGDKQRKQLQEILSAIHGYTCAAGKTYACDKSYKI